MEEKQKKARGYPIHIPGKIEEMEKKDVREAYSSLKVIHIQLKWAYLILRSQLKAVNKELQDYKERYNHLVKYLNNREDE